MDTIDFSRSCLRFRVDLAAQPAITLSHKMPTTVNNVRILLECRTTLTHVRTGQVISYVLGASCKTERVGGTDPLWLEPNADFCLAASKDEFLITKCWQRNNIGVMRNPPSLGPQPERQIGLVPEAWASFSIEPRIVKGRMLAGVHEVINAIRDDKPIVAVLEYTEGDYRVVIEHPVKTINYSEKELVYQTDTGPVLVPDLTPERRKNEPRLIGCMDLAYAAFNNPEWADVILQVPTPVHAEKAPGVTVSHYSKPRRITGMANRLVEVV